MVTLNFRGKVGIALAGVVTAGSLAAPFALSTTPAGADPQQPNALVVVGSDTTQSVMNALAGFENGKSYLPIQSDLEPSKTQLVSYNALNPEEGGDACITPKVKAATLYRANGSTEGRKMLSRSIQNGVWGNNAGTAPNTFTTGTGGTCGSKGASPRNLVDIARSSSGPSGTGSDLTYLAFGKDALTFAYYSPAAAPASQLSLTKTQLETLFASGPARINGVRYVPCGIQKGSGTYGEWRKRVAGDSEATDDAGTAYCGGFTGTQDGATVQARLQEHDGTGLKHKGDRIIAATAAAATPPAGDGGTGNTTYNEANSVFVVGYSAAVFVSQANKVAIDRIPEADVASGKWNLGRADNLTPYTTAVVNGSTVYSPGSPLFSNSTWSRRVYNVVSTARLNDESGDLGMKGLLVSTDLGKPAVPGVPANHTAAICTPEAQAIVNLFGFLSDPADCGKAATYVGPYVLSSSPNSPT